MTLIGDMVRSAGGTLVLTLGRFAGMTIIARRLGVEDFGTIAFAVFCIEILVVLCLIGLPGTMTRYLPLSTRAGGAARHRFRRLCLIWVSGAAMLGLLATPVIGTLALDLMAGQVIVFVAWGVLGILGGAGMALMQGSMRFGLLAFANGLSGAVYVIGAMLLVSPGDVGAALIVLMLANLALFLPALATRQQPPGQETAEMPETRHLIGFGVNVWLTSVTALLLWSRGEMMVLKLYLDERALGLYGAAITIAALVWRAVALLQGAVAPHLSHRMTDGDAERVAKFVQTMNRLTLAAACWVAVLLAFFGTEMVVAIFGEAFRPAGPLVQLIAPAAAMAGTGTVRLAVQFLSEGRFTRDLQIAGAIVLMLSATVLLSLFALPGAALARSFTLVVSAVALPAWLIAKGYVKLGREVGVDLGLATSVVIAAMVIQFQIEPALWFRVLLCFCVLYGAGFAISGRLGPGHMVRYTVERLRGI